MRRAFFSGKTVHLRACIRSKRSDHDIKECSNRDQEKSHRLEDKVARFKAAAVSQTKHRQGGIGAVSRVAGKQKRYCQGAQAYGKNFGQ